MGNSSEISAQHLPQGTHLAQGMHLALQISLLGEFALRQGETIITLDTPSYQALLAYLVVEAQHIHSRQQLAFQFWPDSSESQAPIYARRFTPCARLYLTPIAIWSPTGRPCSGDVMRRVLSTYGISKRPLPRPNKQITRPIGKQAWSRPSTRIMANFYPVITMIGFCQPARLTASNTRLL